MVRKFDLYSDSVIVMNQILKLSLTLLCLATFGSRIYGPLINLHRAIYENTRFSKVIMSSPYIKKLMVMLTIHKETDGDAMIPL